MKPKTRKRIFHYIGDRITKSTGETEHKKCVIFPVTRRRDRWFIFKINTQITMLGDKYVLKQELLLYFKLFYK